jgi:hypothetical protein
MTVFAHGFDVDAQHVGNFFVRQAFGQAFPNLLVSISIFKHVRRLARKTGLSSAGATKHTLQGVFRSRDRPIPQNRTKIEMLTKTSHSRTESVALHASGRDEN